MTRDYGLYDECGEPIGTVIGARERPVLGRNAPTFYLQREPE